MSLTAEDMQYLCTLSKLAPQESELVAYAEQCGSIIDHMKDLAQADTEGIEPLYTPSTHKTMLREDVSDHKRTREEVLKNAPLTDGTYFIVPKIIDGK